MDALVVGAGEMGRWLGDVLAVSGDFTVAFADADPDAAEDAAETVAGRAVDADGDEEFDLVALAVPLADAADAVAAHADRATRGMVDVTGTMAAPVEAMGEHLPDRERVSLHPLFAPANEPGTVATVADEPGPATEAVADAIAARGNDIVETTAAEHDRAMETVQARAHAAVLAYALAAEDVPDWAETPVSATLDDVVETVTGGTPRVYADVQAAFDGAGDVAAAAELVAEAAGADGEADHESFTELYREAGGTVSGSADADPDDPDR